MKWLKRRRLRKELKSYPRSHHDDRVDSLLYATGWRPNDLRPKRRWWQFWKRRTKIRGLGSDEQLRGRPSILGTKPDVLIIDDPEVDTIKAPDELARWYKEYKTLVNQRGERQ